MSEEIAITPRNLGCIRLKKYCPKCLKFLLELRFKPPYAGFGAQIFSDAQKSQEAILGHYFATDGCLPKEFTPFCDCVARVDCSKKYTKYRTTHKSGIVLYGEPDEVLRRKNGCVCVLDHKTARNKGDQDKFHGQYETQVIGYSYIAEGLGLGEATTGGLLYWEAQPEAVEADPADHYARSTLWLGFKPSPPAAEIDYSALDPLIKELKAVWNATELPEGRDGCDDCRKRELLFAIDEEYRRRDETTVRTYPDSPSMRQHAKSRLLNQAGNRMRLLAEFGAVGDAVFSRDGVVANWEYMPVEDSVQE